MITDKIEVYICPVCGETEKHPKERTYGLNLDHCHFDKDTGREYHVQMEKVLEIEKGDIAEW